MHDIRIELLIITPYIYALTKISVFTTNELIKENPQMEKYRMLIELGHLYFIVGIFLLWTL